MASGKKGLGGGLSNLFGDTTVVDLKTETSADSVSKIAVSRIEPNPGQPRKVFAQEALDELAESIRLHGVITPITVRAGKKEGYYQIIAGERRWRAARQAGLDEIPAMVIEASESEVMELALIENLQRQDLNPIEEAEGYEQLMRDYGLTQEQVAQRVVKSRPAVANALRLLQLPGEVRTMVSRGELSGGHARAVLARRGGGQARRGRKADGRHDRSSGRGARQAHEQKACGAKAAGKRLFRGLYRGAGEGAGKRPRP